MKPCDDYQDDILGWDELDRGRRLAVQQHLEQCEGCRGLLKESRIVLSMLRDRRDSPHIDGDHLTRYALQRADPETPDYDGRSLSAIDISRIDAHVNECTACSGAVGRIRAEFEEIEAHLQEAGVPSPETPVDARSRWERLSKLFQTSGLAAAAAVAVALVAVWPSPWLRGPEYPYRRLARIEEAPGRVTRGEGGALAEALSAFNRGEHLAAIEGFEAFVRAHPEDPQLFFAHYQAGLACLTAAPRSFLGRFRRFDVALIERGRRHLRDAIAATDNRRLREDAHWLMAKSYLMQADTEGAEEALGRVVALSGRRAGAAGEMLEELRRLRPE